jgi:1-deoxy-D-xylulose-5-phosphate reductoisomerase
MSKLIVLEGLDGSGKGTQTELLQAHLKQAGYRTHVIDFPNYRSEGSALVKLYLNGGLGKDPDDTNAYAASMFFAADRYVSYVNEWRDDYAREDTVVIANESQYEYVAQELSALPIKVFTGAEALCHVVANAHIDVVLTAMVGFAGLRPTIAAIKAHKTIALANKETLVVAGEIIGQLAHEYKVPIIPVDSEHSAIFQCLAGEGNNRIEKLLLTASGGPFRKLDRQAIANVTPAQALRHPNWEMGAKITIDSATLMNKGFEMIEAKWLFDVAPADIEVVVHPESIIHSAVQFNNQPVCRAIVCLYYITTGEIKHRPALRKEWNRCVISTQ